MPSRLVLSIILIGLSLAPGAPAGAKVFASQNQAISEAFPQATRVDRETHVLRSKEVADIEKIAREKLDSKIVVIHVAYENDQVIGYAHIDVHNVRTQPEAFMVVLDPSGAIRSVRVLAFHEPLDYLPTDRWYGQFRGKDRSDTLRVGHDLHGVVGATLSARAAARGVRRMLAYWEVLMKPKQALDPGDSGQGTDGARTDAGSLQAEGSRPAEGSWPAEGSAQAS